MYFGIQDTTGEGRREEQKHSVANVLKRTAPDKWERSDLDMIAVVPCCKNKDDEKRDVERHEEETVLMDKEDCREKLELEEYVPPYHEECIQRDSQMFWMCVVDQRNSKTGTHGEWTKTNQRGVERPREGGSRAKACEGIFLAKRGIADGRVNNDDQFEQ